ncbi:MAG: sulfatase-like hydrolase/transferase [Planctomycetota bacterium]
MNRRDFLKKWGAATAAASMPGLLSSVSQAGTQPSGSGPNIVFILADDMGYGDPGCYNPDSRIPTPNIDSLAETGMQFNNAHAPGTWCAPSRYALLTGRFPLRTHIQKIRHSSAIAAARETIGTLLQKNGYETGCVGKWHLGIEDGWKDRDWSQPLRDGPVDRGFDYYFGLAASLDIPPYYYIEDDRPVEPPTEHIEANGSEGWTKIQGAFWREGKIAPNFRHDEVLPTLIEKSRSFIKRHQKNDPDSPFFLYLPLTAPHTPWLPDDEYQGASGAEMYGDFTVQVDDGVGRILSLLDALDLRDDTLVFFSSDNGPVWFESDRERTGHHSTGPLRGMKADAWEGGQRMPFLASWPGEIPAGSTTDEPVCFTDMLATFASIVGDDLADSDGNDSFDISPILFDEADKEELSRPIIIEDRAIIEDGWKLIYGKAQGGLSRGYGSRKYPRLDGRLFHLEEDIGEDNNLYEDYPEIVEKLQKSLQQAKKRGRTRPLGCNC